MTLKSQSNSMRRKGSVLNDLTLQIIETALTKLSSASMGLCLFLKITDIIHDQNDCICWRKITNNDKEQQWSLCLTYSAKSLLHLPKIGWFSSVQENKANMVNQISETETEILGHDEYYAIAGHEKSKPH